MNIELSGVGELLMKWTETGYLITTKLVDEEETTVIKAEPVEEVPLMVEHPVDNPEKLTEVEPTKTMEEFATAQPGIRLMKAAPMLGMAFHTLLQKVRKGDIPGYKEKGVWVVPQEFVMPAVASPSKRKYDKWISVKEASVELGTTTSNIYGRIKAGSIPKVRKYKGKRVVSLAAIQEIKASKSLS